MSRYGPEPYFGRQFESHQILGRDPPEALLFALSHVRVLENFPKSLETLLKFRNFWIFLNVQVSNKLDKMCLNLLKTIQFQVTFLRFLDL